MTKLNRLRLEALESCNFRGHKMSKFAKSNYWPDVRHSECKVCFLTCTIDATPLPNGIEIGGGAVALHCIK